MPIARPSCKWIRARCAYSPSRTLQHILATYPKQHPPPPSRRAEQRGKQNYSYIGHISARPPLQGGRFEYRHAHARAIYTPSAMPRCLSQCGCRRCPSRRGKHERNAGLPEVHMHRHCRKSHSSSHGLACVSACARALLHARTHSHVHSHVCGRSAGAWLVVMTSLLFKTKQLPRNKPWCMPSR